MTDQTDSNQKGQNTQDSQDNVGNDDYVFEEETGDRDNESGQGSSEFAKLFAESSKKSQKRLKVGDKIEAEILVIGREEAFVALGPNRDGAVARKDLLDEKGELPHKVGDRISLFVTLIKGDTVRLSPKPTSKNLADDLQDAFDMMLPVEGKVVEVCKGGVRVSVLGKLAFCPISQLDSNRTETGEEFVGQRLQFKITQISEGGKNIVVSRRKLLDEERGMSTGAFLSEHRAGDVVTGRVSRLEAFGAFIELAPGLDGLAHISELSWSRVAKPEEAVTVGQVVKVKILKIETLSANTSGAGHGQSKARISLSIKQAGVQPWDDFNLKTGQVVSGRVTKIMKFGAFVAIAPGIEGLVPLSEMSYTKRVIKAEEVVSEGASVEVMIKEIDPVEKKILLSIRDAGADPWSLVETKFKPGTMVHGVVEKREAYGLFVKIEEGVTGLLPKSKTHEHPEFSFEKVRPGDTLMVQVLELNRESRKLTLGLPKEGEDWRDHMPTSTVSASMGTLGGAFGDKLAAALKKSKA